MWSYNYSDELYHYGVKGMKWGVRKNRKVLPKSDANKKYDSAKADYKQAKKAYKQEKRDIKKERRNNKPQLTPEEKAARRKKAIKIGAAVAGTALAAYGAYKLNDYVKTSNYNIAAERGYKAAERSFKQKEKWALESMKNPLPGQTHAKIEIRSNAHLNARQYAKDSKNDNFRTAARNVKNYKRSGGDLKSLNRYSSDFYLNNRGSSVTFEKHYKKKEK